MTPTLHSGGCTCGPIVQIDEVYQLLLEGAVEGEVNYSSQGW